MTALRELIDQAIDEGAVGPDEVADKVLPNIDDDDRESLIRRAVRDAARERLRLIRGPAAQERVPSQGESKFAAAREVASDPKRWQVWVPQWKTLGECTADEVAFVADQYRERAAKNAAYADRYDRLRAAMVKAKAGTVGDLDDTVVEELMA